MNFLWGVVNTGIAAMGIAGVRKETTARLNYEESYNRYLATKKLYLINAGLDVLYIGAGVGLYEYSQSAKNNQALYSGFGKSIAIQGVFLLLFDNCMIAAHLRYNSRWYVIMNELRISNSGIGISHNF